MPPLPLRDLDHVVFHAGEAFKALADSRVFITGGTGFVGTWLLESLLRADLGISATVLTRNPRRFRTENPHLSAIQLIEGDIRTFPFPTGEFPFLIHAATPHPDLEVDLESTRRVLEFAVTHGTRRLLFASSGAVYGVQPPELSHIPEDHPLTPVTDYGKAKKTAEEMCRSQGAVIGRLFAFSGPRLPLDRNFAIGNFIRDSLRGTPIRVQGDGTPHRSYLYAADLAIWLWTLLARGEPAKPYNVGTDQAVSIGELARIIADETAPGATIEIAQMPVLNAPVARYVPSIERARQELGLRPVITLKDGIRRAYEWAKIPAANAR